MIGVDGRIQTRSYEDSNGKRVYITEVVCDNVQFLETNKQDEKQKDKPYYYKDDKKDEPPF